jgi:hypothetical protein
MVSKGFNDSKEDMCDNIELWTSFKEMELY